MEKEFEKIVNTIKGFTNDFVAQQFYHKKLDQNLLCVFLGGGQSSILIYSTKNGFNHIAEIRYRASGNSMFVSAFECDSNFQQNGLGRFLLDMAMAHADLKGCVTMYGVANPTNEIKGVSGEGVLLEDEKQALYKIYKKLGCSLENIVVNNQPTNDIMFKQCWVSGQKLSNLNASQQSFIKQIGVCSSASPLKK